jgi:hypothetical protein
MSGETSITTVQSGTPDTRSASTTGRKALEIGETGFEPATAMKLAAALWWEGFLSARNDERRPRTAGAVVGMGITQVAGSG